MHVLIKMFVWMGFNQVMHLALGGQLQILGLQSISWDVADNVNHPRRLDPTMEFKITYSFVLYLQHGRHDVNANHQ